MPHFIESLWAGWLYLLPPLPGQRVLIICPPDAGLVRTVARQAADTVWADTEFAEDEEPLPTGVNQIRLDWGQLHRPGDQGFDLVLLFLPPAQMPAIKTHHSRLCGLLTPTGLLFTQVVNPLRSAGNPRQKFRTSIDYWRWLFRTAGRGSSFLASYPVNLRHGEVSELQVHPTYQPLQNTFLLREKLKRWLLRGLLAGGISEAWVTLWANEQQQTTRLNRPRDEVYQQAATRAMELADLEQAELLNYLVLNQKAILMIGPCQPDGAGMAGAAAGVVAVLCNTDYLYQRRVSELELLSTLRTQFPSIATAIPEPLGNELVAGVPVCFQRRMPGITIEADFAGLPAITEQAQGFLKKLIEGSGASRQVDPSEIDRFFRPLLRSARQRTPAFAHLIDALAERLVDQLKGQQIMSVVMHGDFKIENAMFSPDSFELTAVIDWDLGDLQGYPYLDLWYLLLYNRLITRQQSFFTAFQALLIDGESSADESRLIADYGEFAGVRDDQLWCLKGLLLFFHIGSRAHLGSAPPVVKSELEETLRRLLNAES